MDDGGSHHGKSHPSWQVIHHGSQVRLIFFWASRSHSNGDLSILRCVPRPTCRQVRQRRGLGAPPDSSEDPPSVQFRVRMWRSSVGEEGEVLEFSKIPTIDVPAVTSLNPEQFY